MTIRARKTRKQTDQTKVSKEARLVLIKKRARALQQEEARVRAYVESCQVEDDCDGGGGEPDYR